MAGRAKSEKLWVQWDRRRVQDLACSPWMTQTCWRVLACMVAELQMDGRTHATQQSMGQTLGIVQQQISQTIQVLKREGVVYQERRAGPYFLAIAYVYCGDRAHRAHWEREERRRRREKQPDGKTQTRTGRGTGAPALG